MNISGVSTATNYANIQSSKLTQLSSGLVVKQASGSNTAQGSARLLQLDLSDRKGYREDYSIRDAAESLWKQETQTFNLKDLNDPTKANDIIENMRRQARWDLGIETGETKDEVMSAYILNLRVLDKLERNYKGEELTTQRTKLEEVYQAGKAEMINGYTQLLQDNLGISGDDVQAVKDSFSAILAEKVDAYRGALEKVHGVISQTGPDSVWLKNHDAYISSQLRAVGSSSESTAAYSVQDLTAAGQIAQSYQTEIFNASSCGRNEATLALNLSMADMKAETMIQKGLVSKNMAALLRNSRAQGHNNALATLDQALSVREKNLAPGEPKGTFAPVDRTVFQGIYNAVMNAYHENGGDGAGAIRAGVAYGQSITTQATVKNPNALRWGISIESYWKDFYTDPDDKEISPLVKQMNRLLVQAGQTSDLGCSTYQKYINSWQDFLSSVGGGVDVRA